MNTNTSYDLIVIGGGPIGLSTAYHGAKEGLKILVIEKFSYFNNLGSSAGYSRQFRLQYEQDYMSQLSLSSQPFWCHLQRYTDVPLVGSEGSLWFGQNISGTQEGGIDKAKVTMDTLGIPYEPLANAQGIESKASFEGLPKAYYGFFQKDGGTINVKATEQVLYNAALATGNVTFKEWESVVNIDNSEENCIKVFTQRSGQGMETLSYYQSAKLAITAGAYVNDTVRYLGFSVPILIWQMASAYFKKIDEHAHFPSWFAFQSKPEDSPYQPESATNSLLYGFPELDWANPGFVRVATDFPDYKIIYDPSERQLAPSAKSLDIASSWVEQFMPGLDPTPQHTSTCLIALCNDPKLEEQPEFFLDYLPKEQPNSKNIVTYTAGWAGKFIPIMGDMIIKMLQEPALEKFTYSEGERVFNIPRNHFAINWQPAGEVSPVKKESK
ncbi:FAD-dependent oxidoreductase [Pseudoalteromonas luteoviolacea]|uniref:FAD dependent oxidoreductase domain-containing protein n=1 Tax=Pseudoalteromonas luteoviolacea S4054 TaxID=1129367 RepID=A0A0F6AFT7_9GAMM|nr:FAD-dependent oxidoreductase [Pseudoalteromonas luteoviolacea]AOT08308.1 hypothetical protein S4054249_10830 [Pseudoalteromonas luteoviolacea]AOT13224.1 hypothetical protein S40542_10805 [Pseudoalteromonas luteoviolacea]AOT18137.1 hypothetical protein S4054_10805 [Pseudoalteromonas luteoviolacea]KKE84244.1 hypothetical protein N479_10115 [Pseudoalteromonas luteoviolacea S4054]KZN76151.1 hypothetical protein N481_07300 [Pseudoalteromonas luteoviolacea S4047-1]